MSRAAVQMYTLRDYCKTAADFASTLKKVRDIGYEAVQLSGVGCMNGDEPEVSAAEARKLLDENGLKCIATHRSWADLSTKTAKEIDFHHTLGCDFTAIGGLDGQTREKGAAGYRQFLEEAKPVIAKLKDAGIKFGYHNHSFEFIQYGDGQKTCYDIFVDEGYDDFLMEIDTYWVVNAGVDAARMFERCTGRVPVIHLKDKVVFEGNETRFAPIGQGNLEWDIILPACRKAGVEWYAVEQDNCFDEDPFDCLKLSFDFLQTKGI